MVSTAALVRSMQRMRRRGMVVRRLASAETLGGVTVVCADKTGTLTRNDMRLEMHRPRRRRPIDPPHGARRAGRDCSATGRRWRWPPRSEQRRRRPATRRAAGRSSAARPSARWCCAAEAAGLDRGALRRAYPRRAAARARRRRALRRQRPRRAGRRRAWRSSRARPSRCCRCARASTTVRLRRRRRAARAGPQRRAGRRRACAFSRSAGDALRPTRAGASCERGYTLIGLVGLRDPLRAGRRRGGARRGAGRRSAPSFSPAISAAPPTAIARAVGLQGETVDGPRSLRLLARTRGAARARLRRVAVFARVTPADKVAIVQGAARRR